MRFVALKRLTYTGPDGAKYAIMPGQAVPDFESWPSGVRHANIASHMVRDTHARAPTIVGTEVRMACYARVEEPLPVAEAAVSAEAVCGTDASFADAAADKHMCPHCDHAGFSVKNSLMQHIKRKH